jgi:putative endonuclease
MLDSFFVYILANKKNGTLYIGVTNDIERRVFEHKVDMFAGFTSKYGVKMLVYYETLDGAEIAIRREKQLKKWKRDWKIRLIESANREWKDLSDGWYRQEDFDFQK